MAVIDTEIAQMESDINRLKKWKESTSPFMPRISDSMIQQAEGNLLALKQKKAQEVQQQSMRDQYLSQLGQYKQTITPYISELSDPNALRAIYDAAAQRSRARMASEYAARGLSGSGEYAAGLSQAYAQLGQQEAQDLERRRGMAAQLQSGLVGMEGQAQQSFFAQDAQTQQLAMQQEQIKQAQAERERQRTVDLWKGIGSIGLGAATIAAPYLLPVTAGAGMAMNRPSAPAPDYTAAGQYNNMTGYSMAQPAYPSYNTPY